MTVFPPGQTKLCLHFYACEVTMDRFLEIERGATAALDWGCEVRRVGRGQVED